MSRITRLQVSKCAALEPRLLAPALAFAAVAERAVPFALLCSATSQPLVLKPTCTSLRPLFSLTAHHRTTRSSTTLAPLPSSASLGVCPSHILQDKIPLQPLYQPCALLSLSLVCTLTASSPVTPAPQSDAPSAPPPPASSPRSSLVLSLSLSLAARPTLCHASAQNTRTMSRADPTSGASRSET